MRWTWSTRRAHSDLGQKRAAVGRDVGTRARTVAAGCSAGCGGCSGAARSPAGVAPSMRSSGCASLVRVVAAPEPDLVRPPVVGRGPADQADTVAPCCVTRLVEAVNAGTRQRQLVARVTSSAAYGRERGADRGVPRQRAGCSSHEVRAAVPFGKKMILTIFVLVFRSRLRRHPAPGGIQCHPRKRPLVELVAHGAGSQAEPTRHPAGDVEEPLTAHPGVQPQNHDLNARLVVRHRAFPVMRRELC